MKKQKTKNNIILTIIIILLFIIVLWLLTILLSPKYKEKYPEGNMISEYYDETKNHEVILLGDCEIYANFSPLEFYSESGITAYNRASSQQLLWQSYYLLKETLKYETPKVVVLSVNAMKFGEPVSEAYNRMTIDKMKWSKEKIDIINASMTEEEDFISYVFPILRYHSRISDLSSEDFKYFGETFKNTYEGFLVNKKVKGVGTLPIKKELGNYKFSETAYDYLNKITKLCKDNKIKLLLVKAPSVYPYWYDEYNRQIVEYSKENKIGYINLLEKKDDIGLDYSTDTYDGGLHLNLFGAVKLSKYFATYLKDNYKLTDYRKNREVREIYKEKMEKYKEVFK